MRSQVVIADSNEMLLAAYRAFLSAEGFEAVTVTNGVDCLAAMREAKPCVLVIDPDMPWENDREKTDGSGNRGIGRLAPGLRAGLEAPSGTCPG